jgi:hypothetical protein
VPEPGAEAGGHKYPLQTWTDQLTLSQPGRGAVYAHPYHYSQPPRVFRSSYGPNGAISFRSCTAAGLCSNLRKSISDADYEIKLAFEVPFEIMWHVAKYHLMET